MVTVRDALDQMERGKVGTTGAADCVAGRMFTNFAPIGVLAAVAIKSSVLSIRRGGRERGGYRDGRG